MSESVIMCEGFHDRAFWKGWLTYLGCTDLGAATAGKTRPAQILDPFGVEVKGGQFAYHSTRGAFLRVVPCHGRSKVLHEARVRLLLRNTKALMRLVLNIDADLNADGSATAATGLRHQDVEQFIRTQVDPSAAVNADGEVEIDGGATKVALVRWETADPHALTLPAQQTLERLVSAALIAAYPTRAKPIQDWLASRPAPPPPDPKEHSRSHMAGWYAEHGCESFFSNLWSDPKIVGEMESRLRLSGAWRIAEALAS